MKKNALKLTFLAGILVFVSSAAVVSDDNTTAREAALLLQRMRKHFKNFGVEQTLQKLNGHGSGNAYNEGFGGTGGMRQDLDDLLNDPSGNVVCVRGGKVEVDSMNPSNVEKKISSLSRNTRSSYSIIANTGSSNPNSITRIKYSTKLGLVKDASGNSISENRYAYVAGGRYLGSGNLCCAVID